MKYVFATGMGRSGTKFLATLLNQFPEVSSQHEYIGNREFWTLSWYLPGDIYASTYLKKTKSEIENKFNSEIFFDVNSMLQNCVPALEEVFKPSKIFHLVRDPRAVVRSLYSRRSDKNIHLIPKTKIEIEKWLASDKFYQVCWNWNTTTEKLLSEKTSLIRFEDLTSNFIVFKDTILRPLELEMSEEQWKNIISKKVNETKSKVYRFVYAKMKGKDFVDDELPNFDEWPDDLKRTLFNVCGETMKMCGYM